MRPACGLARGVVLDLDAYLGAYPDREAAAVIGGLWLLAARSPRSLIHLPMRGNPPPAGAFGEGRRLDVALVPRAMQFAPSRRKQVRARLDAGRPQTVEPAGVGPGEGPDIDHRARHHRENRDLFRQHVHADTLFMTGTAKVFRETAGRFLDVAREGPGFVPGHPNHGHFCTEFHGLDRIPAPGAREIHVEYCTRWAAASGRPAGWDHMCTAGAVFEAGAGAPGRKRTAVTSRPIAKNAADQR
ncbi:hypothetical protein [Embleya sp. NPDC059259]|uniref:hypothetical protein n=1 Tax=unclassified Embleya TaxID=2699296 RepID=UPI0036CE7D0C